MNLLIVDDHAVVRAGFSRLFGPRPEVTIRYAANGQEALRAVRELPPDVIILDIDLPDVSGFTLLRRLRLEAADSPILIATMYSDISYAEQAMELGAAGYVTKSAAPEELLLAIEQVSAGKRYIEASICQEMVHRSINARQLGQDLTAREVDIIRLLAEGKSVGEIANAVGVSYKTVANNCSLLRIKLGLGSIKDLIRYAITWKLKGTEFRAAR